MKEEKGEKINVLSSHVNKVKCKGARQSRKRRSLDRQTWLTIVKDGRVIRRVRRCQTNALTSRRSRDDPKGWIETILFTLSLVQRCRQHNADIYKKKFYPPGFFLFLSFFLSFFRLIFLCSWFSEWSFGFTFLSSFPFLSHVFVFFPTTRKKFSTLLFLRSRISFALFLNDRLRNPRLNKAHPDNGYLCKFQGIDIIPTPSFPP